MSGIESLFINSIAAVAVCGIFVWFMAKIIVPYIMQKDKDMKEIINEFNLMISNHLSHSNQVIKEETESNLKVMLTLQELSDYIRSLNGKKKEK